MSKRASTWDLLAAPAVVHYEKREGKLCPKCGEFSTPSESGRCMNGPMGAPCGHLLVRAPRTVKRRSLVLEKHVMRAARSWLARQRDVHVERVNVSSFGERRQYKSASKGSADLHLRVRGSDGIGRALFCECKRPGAVQRPEQIDYQREVEAAGCTYVVEDSPGLETLRKAVEELRRAG